MHYPYPKIREILDRREPDTPPSRRYCRLEALFLECRDPNSGQGGGPEDKPRHQYARAGGRLWCRRLPPESVGEEWRDGPARWELVREPVREPDELLRTYLEESEDLPLVVVRRERFSVDGETEFCVGGEYVSDDEAEDVSVAAAPVIGAWWDVPLPACPDCGGTLVWWEAGYVPGTRRCVGPQRADGSHDVDGGCGSLFSVQVRHVSDH